MSHISESTSNSPLFSFFLPIKELIEALQQHPKSGSIETVEKALESLSLQGRSLSEHELSLAQRQLTDLTAELSLVKQLLEPEESAPFTQYHSLIELASMYRRGDLEQARWHYEQLSPATKDKLCLHLWLIKGSPDYHNFGTKGFEDPTILPLDCRPSRYDLALAVEMALTPSSVLVELKKLILLNDYQEIKSYVDLLPIPVQNRIFGETYKEKKEPKNVPLNFGELAFFNKDSYATTQEEKIAIIDRVLISIDTSYEPNNLLTTVQSALKQLKSLERVKMNLEEKKQQKRALIADLLEKLLPLYTNQPPQALANSSSTSPREILSEAFKVYPLLLQCRALFVISSDINDTAPTINCSSLVPSQDSHANVRTKAIRSIAAKMLLPTAESALDSRASPASTSGAPGFSSQARSLSARYTESVVSSEARSMASSPVLNTASEPVAASSAVKFLSQTKIKSTLSASSAASATTSIFGSAAYLGCLKNIEEKDAALAASGLLQFSKIIQLLNLDLEKFSKNHTHVMGVLYKGLALELDAANQLYQQLKLQNLNELASWLSMMLPPLRKKYETAFGLWIDEMIENCRILQLPSLSNEQILALELEKYQAILTNIYENPILKDLEKATLFAGFVESINLQTTALPIVNPMMAKQVQKTLQRLAESQQLNDPRLLSDLASIHETESYQREMVLDFWLSYDLLSQIRKERDQVLRLHMSFAKHSSYPYGDDLTKLIDMLDTELATLEHSQASALEMYVSTIQSTEMKIAQDVQALASSGAIHPAIARHIKLIRQPLSERIIETFPNTAPIFSNIFAHYPG